MAVSENSDHINKILEQMGLTAKNIRRRQNGCLWFQFAFGYPDTCGYQNYYPCVCGSVSRGLVSPLDQTSDLDIQYVLPVNIVDPNKTLGQLKYQFVNKAVYTIQDSISHPLFKRFKRQDGNSYLTHGTFQEAFALALLENGNAMNLILSETLKNGMKLNSHVKVDTMVNIAGPSVNLSTELFKDTSMQQSLNTDNVQSIRYFYWPEDMGEWFSRKRNFRWPTPKTIDKIEQVGCSFVSKGFDGSEEFDIEWRLSFTLAEDILTDTFNDTQRKCYVLLKLFHKKYINPKFPEMLSSYHIKMLMFWMCEDTCHSNFTRDRLLECFFMCIDRLVAYLSQCFCPLYFMRNVNLFYRIDLHTCNQIVAFLGEVKDNIFPSFIRDISIVSQFFDLNFKSIEMASLRYQAGYLELGSYRNLVGSISQLSNLVKQENCLDTLLKQLEVRYFVFNYDQSTLDKYLCTVKSDLLSIAVAAHCEMRMPNKKRCQFLKSYLSLLPKYFSTETCPAILKRASICFKFGKYTECLHLALNVIERLTNDNVIYLSSHNDIAVSMCLKLATKMMCTANKVRQFCSNIVFSPLERSIVPDCVQHEMDIPKTYDNNSWLGWAFVDAIIFAYYLAVMCQHQVEDYPTRDGLMMDMQDVYNRRFADLCYPDADCRFLQYCQALRFPQVEQGLVINTTNGLVSLLLDLSSAMIE